MRLTILLGAEVALQWRAKLMAMRGEERVQVDGLVTSVFQVPGEPEPRVVVRDLPETLSDMVGQAGQDNNHLQKKVNVHEAAFTWARRYKMSKSKSERHRLQDLLLPGSSAVFTAVPSRPLMMPVRKSRGIFIDTGRHQPLGLATGTRQENHHVSLSRAGGCRPAMGSL